MKELNEFDLLTINGGWFPGAGGTWQGMTYRFINGFSEGFADAFAETENHLD